MSAVLFVINLVYISTFTSWYLQLPGLIGYPKLNKNQNGLDYVTKIAFLEELNLVKVAHPILQDSGLSGNPAQTLQYFCLLGISLSALMLYTRKNHSILLATQFLLYLAIVLSGNIFSSFQWDILLLEAGFLAIFLGDFGSQNEENSEVCRKRLALWLLQWLLFRLMFASGVVKLKARGDTWWSLKALTKHFETQCIPNPVSWYAHQMPLWVLQFSEAAMFFIEIWAPLFFLIPTKFAYKANGLLQIMLQIMITLTGNYNFFNLLTIGLSLSYILPDRYALELPGAVFWNALLIGISSFALYDISQVQVFLQWNKDFLFRFLELILPIVVAAGFVFTLGHIGRLIGALLNDTRQKRIGVMAWIGSLATILVAVQIYPLSSIVFSRLSTKASIGNTKFPIFIPAAQYTVHSYGLFASMTLTRPEVILEFSIDDQKTWIELDVVSKPNKVDEAPPILWTMQPRVAWQFWFAALALERQPDRVPQWVVSMMQQLLKGSEPVAEFVSPTEPILARTVDNKLAPLCLRAKLYSYSFTDKWDQPEWWQRRYMFQFFPPRCRSKSR